MAVKHRRNQNSETGLVLTTMRLPEDVLLELDNQAKLRGISRTRFFVDVIRAANAGGPKEAQRVWSKARRKDIKPAAAPKPPNVFE